MAIQLPDARQLSDGVLEALRLRALHGCEQGYPETELADLLGVARETISRWWSAYQEGGLDQIPHARTGRPVGVGRTLSDQQGRQLRGKIEKHLPSEYGIASPLWTRRAVRDLIRKEYDIDMPIRTVGEYLKRWGYTPKRPRRKAKGQDPEEIEEWLEHIYPAIAEYAQEQGAEIHWCDEKGVDANEQTGRGYGPKGVTPEIEVASHPSRISVVSTITAEGKVRFMTYSGTLTAAVFITFLGRLVQGASKKILLIADRLPAHTAAAVEAWLNGREDKIELFFLPAHAPERNPDEYLNNDIHQGVNAMKLPDTKEELRSNIQVFLQKLAKLPDHVKSFFRNPFIQYAGEDV